MAGNETLMEFPKDLDIVVVNMDKVLFEGKGEYIIVPGPYGNTAVMPGHTPLFTQLLAGKVVIHNQKDEEIEINGGIAKITQGKVTILVGF